MLIQVSFLLHGHKCFVTNGKNSHFFRLMHSTKLYNSTQRTDLKGVKISYSASKMSKLCVIRDPDVCVCQSERETEYESEANINDNLQI